MAKDASTPGATAFAKSLGFPRIVCAHVSQPSAGLHQALLQSRQRRVPNLLRLQLGESLETGSVAEEDWELVADDFAAALGEDRRTAVKHARKQCGGIQEIWRKIGRA